MEIGNSGKFCGLVVALMKFKLFVPILGGGQPRFIERRGEISGSSIKKKIIDWRIALFSK
jgi:hypothetical protein